MLLGIFQFNIITFQHSNKSIGERNISMEDIAKGIIGFEASGAGYVSTANDPHIEVLFNDSISGGYINIKIKNLKLDSVDIWSTSAQVFYALDGQYNELFSTRFKLKKGNNIIRIPDYIQVNSLRMDLAETTNVYFELESIKITSKFLGLYQLLLESFILTAVSMLLYFFINYRREDFCDVVDRINNITKKTFQTFALFGKELYQFILNNKFAFFVVVVVGCAGYGLLCTYYTIYIDEERAIIEARAGTGWLAQGRYGNYFIEKLLLVDGNFTTYLGDFIAALLLLCSSIIQCFNLSRIKKDGKLSKAAIIGFCSLYITMPYVSGAYMIVGVYNIQLGIALCLTAVVGYFILNYNKIKKIDYFYIVIMFSIAISVYQAFVPLFITMVVLYALCTVIFDETIYIKKIVFMIIRSAIVCVVSVGIYYIFNLYFVGLVGASSYLSDSFIGWGKGNSVINILKKTIYTIYKILLGSKELLYGGMIIKVTFILFIAFSLLWLLLYEKRKLFFIFLCGCSIFAPFSMNFVLGNTMFAGRTMLGIPLLIGTIWVILIEKSEKIYILRMISTILVCYLIVVQVQYLNKYFLADYKRYQMDQIASEEIINDIREANNGIYEVPVVFVGTYNYSQNGLMVPYELAGSYFSVDGGSISRITRFIQAEGYGIKTASREQIIDSYSYYRDMASWPEEGSVKAVNGYIIVKLSNPTEMWENAYIGVIN
jgi:hypothetical protein